MKFGDRVTIKGYDGFFKGVEAYVLDMESHTKMRETDEEISPIEVIEYEVAIYIDSMERQRRWFNEYSIEPLKSDPKTLME